MNDTVIPGTEAAIAPVTRSVVVSAPVERAFDVFTASFASWWPPEHRIGTGHYLGAYIEPRLGGRWFERSEEGAECDWGQVLAWEPPHRVLLSWHLNGDFDYDPDAAHASEVEVRFTSLDATTTRIDLEHRHFARAIRGDRLATGVAGAGGWGALLARFGDLVDGRAHMPVA